MELKFVKGNIVDARVDVIVLPANRHLKEGKGASEAIFKAAGRKDLAKKCKEIGYCDVGFAVPTYGYNLECDIIHAVVPKWIDGQHSEYELLSSAYYSSLQLADTMRKESIAFPLLASGNNGFDLELALEIAIKTIESFSPQCLKDVTIVLFGSGVTAMAKKRGYEVGVLPRNLEKDEKEFLKKKEKQKKAREFADEQVDAFIGFFKDPENRRIVKEAGITAVQIAKKVVMKL